MEPLTLSYWPADTSEPVIESTVGDALRRAADSWPKRVALVAGEADAARRRRWTFESLRLVVTAGAPVPPSLIQRVETMLGVRVGVATVRPRPRQTLRIPTPTMWRWIA